MKNEFIPYKQALALKELGFDEPCICVYNLEGILRLNNIKNSDNKGNSIKLTKNPQLYAPLYQQAFRWFRDKYNLKFVIVPTFNCYNIESIYKYNSNKDKNKKINLEGLDFKDFKTYEEAELECLKKLIEIVKNK